MGKKIEELKPIDLTKYKVTETGQVIKMTEKDLCGGKTFKEVMQEVEFHISDKEKIAKLEKENAELKEQCLILADCDTCYSICKNENVEMKKQLTKARELLRKFLNSKSIEERCAAESEADRFLNSETKEQYFV